MKKVFTKIALVCVSVLCMMGFMACGKADEQTRIYYLNFKPEVAPVWQEIADVYEQETGVELKIITAASGTYEQVLQSEIAKREAPTIFQINGPNALKQWGQYCSDLSDTQLYDWLMDKSLVVSQDGAVYGIPYVVEGYGIIYNKEIMGRYFALPEKATTVSKVEDINNFETLKAVVEDMTLNKDMAMFLKMQSVKHHLDW